MKINKYPDGTSYISLPEYTEGALAPKVFKVNTYEDLHHLEQYVEVYNYKYEKPPVIIIPNLIDAQADKRFNINESSGLKIVCKRLNSMNANFKIFHPHNPEVVEALIDGVEIIDNTNFIQQVLGELGGEHKMLDIFQKNGVLMSSDAGGFKPLMKLCDNIKWGGQVHSCSKGRSYDGKKSELTQRIDKDNFYGKNILIIDDISVYGGTFKGLSKLLRQRNCGKLYLAVSHMTVQNLGEDPVTNYFDKVFTTNSKFDWYGVPNKDGQPDQPENLEIIKMF